MAPKRNQPQADSPCVGDSTLKHHCYEMISKLSKVGSNSRTNKGIEHVLVMSLRGGSLMCRVRNFLLILGFWFMQVLAEELESLKRQRAQMRAASRALAQQEKNVKKRRARLLQAVFFVKRFFIPPWLHLPHEAARQLSQDDLVLLLRQPGGASPTDLDLDLKSSPSILCCCSCASFTSACAGSSCCCWRCCCCPRWPARWCACRRHLPASSFEPLKL